MATAEQLLLTDLAGCREVLEALDLHPDLRADDTGYARYQTVRADLAHLCGDAGEGALASQAARIAWLAAGNQLEARRAKLALGEMMLLAGLLDEAGMLVMAVQHRLERESGHEQLATRLHLIANRQLGVIASARGDHATAMHHFDQAQELALAVGDRLEAARIAVCRGRGLLAAGMAHRGLDLLCGARAAFIEGGATVWADRAVVPISEALTSAGHGIVATEILEQVRPALKGQERMLAELDLAMAGALLGTGLARESLASATRARDLLRDKGARLSYSYAELAVARAALQLRRLDLAEAAVSAADTIADDADMPRLHERARLLAAGVALARDDTDRAEVLGRAILAGKPSAQAAVHARLLIARTTSDTAESHELLAKVSATVDRLGQPDLRLALRVARARHLQNVGELGGALDELRAAAEFAPQRLNRSVGWIDAEATVARATDELITLLLEDGSHGAVTEAWQRLRSANRHAIDGWLRQSEEWHVDPRLDSIETLVARARSHHPAAPASGAAEQTPLSFLPTVEFYVLGEDIACFVVREGLVHARILKDASESAGRLAAAWRRECLLIAAAGDGGATSSGALDALFDLLLMPVAEWLEDLEDTTITVVGHRHLLAVPFEAMLEVGAPWRVRLTGDPRPHFGYPPPVGTRPARALVLAVPDERAPAIEAEARVIAEHLPGAEVYVGAEATSKVLAERVGSADVVHLAAHGRVREGNPMASAIKLGDGWLRTADIVDGTLDLSGRIVVLSGCVSGRSSERTLTPAGLTWACISAGAAGVLSSLWPVDDEATFDLMGRFYDGLAGGMHPRDALARAQRAVARTHPHPYFWAAFQYFVPAL
ncbi:CHAT domain-containing protein [Nocardioides montaniterrae]